jgi:hypothetical protein
MNANKKSRLVLRPIRVHSRLKNYERNGTRTANEMKIEIIEVIAGLVINPSAS